MGVCVRVLVLYAGHRLVCWVVHECDGGMHEQPSWSMDVVRRRVDGDDASLLLAGDVEGPCFVIQAIAAICRSCYVYAIHRQVFLIQVATVYDTVGVVRMVVPPL